MAEKKKSMLLYLDMCPMLEQLGEAGIIIFPHHANQAGWVALISGIKGIQQAEAALRVFLLYTA